MNAGRFLVQISAKYIIIRKERMKFVSKEATMLLFLNVLFVQCITVLKTQNGNDTDMLQIKKMNGYKKCRQNNECPLKQKCVETEDRKERVCAECSCRESFDCLIGSGGRFTCQCPDDHKMIERFFHLVCVKKCDEDDDCLPNQKCLESLYGQGVCEKCDCQYPFVCFLNVHGEPQCKCPTNHILRIKNNEETCLKKCGRDDECSDNQKCHKLENRVKGLCEECTCDGDHEICSFQKGDKRCNCESGFIRNDGVCAACDCGTHGQCRLEKNQKKCKCEEGFVEKNGTCSDCVCRGGTCVKEREKEVCKCPPGYGNFTNTICKACDCGINTDCIWESGFGGRKVCLCKSGFSTKKGKCAACDCEGESSCEWISDGWLKPERKVCHCNKICNCFIGYSQLDGACAECYCGPHGTCSFENGQKKCICKPFVTDINGHCIDKQDLEKLCNVP